jgi:hypothetical protein
MQAADKINVVQVISKQMTVGHDQFKKGDGKYIIHNTHSTYHDNGLGLLF